MQVGCMESHQHVAELAVFVSLVGIKATVAVHHRSRRDAGQSFEISEAGGTPDPAATAFRVVNLRRRDHQTGAGGLQQQWQQAHQHQLMREMIHRKREFKSLRIAARLFVSGVLQSGIEHEAIEGLVSIQKGAAHPINRRQIGKIRQQHSRLRTDPAQSLLSTFLTSADQCEPMTGLFKTSRCVSSDATAGAGEQKMMPLSHGN